MAAVSPIASSTAPNWLKEAQESIAASESPGGLLGALQDARYPASIKNFLTKSQNAANNLSLISSSTAQSQNTLTQQMANTAAQKLMNERAALLQKMNPQQTNFTPPAGLDSFIYFQDGTSIDTQNNILTMANGTQIDTTTGLQVVDPKSIISMANGAYLNTSTNILTMADGTRIDTVTGLKVTA
ncbi:hypothetical protein [Rhodoplanes sp. Z2-YC6860]|uniref:hypothetical protein n=1 Tax=Rhodoplanes sp. Z2-YC6860 TaxID=674703 RepID=UPI0008308BED|nr:hypothetical protein [Rhodoplanes sp. Z2-YC6860]